MKSKAAYLALMAAAMMGSAQGHSSSWREAQETPEERKQRIKKANEQINIQHGMKPYQYGSETIWARNQKNADRKARNKGLI